jgi:hypothetical protein
VGMWESRVLCEISKLLCESFCDFHRSSATNSSAGKTACSNGDTNMRAFAIPIAHSTPLILISTRR